MALVAASSREQQALDLEMSCLSGCSSSESAVVVKRWFHRTDDDASGCTFTELDPKDVAPGAPPVAMLINSSKLRDVFGSEQFKKVVPPAFNAGMRTRGAAVRQLDGVGDTRFVLQAGRDSDIRDACVQAGSVLC